MHIGAAMFFTDYSMSPTELARALEERGFESLWAPEHSHIPLTRKSPFPGGGDLPKKYYDAMDPFVMLTAAAAVTKKLKVGTGVCLVDQRDPIQTAKQVASIDQLSGGRFLFGVGNGWNEDEMENHGTDFESRHKLARERIEAMKVIWTKSKAEYHGEMVKFDPDDGLAQAGPEAASADPGRRRLPLRRAPRRALRRRLDAALRRRKGTPRCSDLLPKFHAMAKEANRDLASVPISIWGAKEDSSELKRDRTRASSRVIVSLDSAKADAILPQLDRWAKLAAKVA